MTNRADIEKALWDGANTFRGKIDAANYKDYVLSMLFLKYLSDKYEELIEDVRKEYKDSARLERIKNTLPIRLDKEYRLKLHKKRGTVEDNNFYISENANNDLYKESKSQRLSEDFADSVMKFFDPNYKNFDKEYPNRYNVLKEIFGV